MTRIPIIAVGWWGNNSIMSPWKAYFAGTPPLEAFRYLIHKAATVRSNEKVGSRVLMVNDVARAFFEAPATRNVCVEIPMEGKTEADVRHDRVGT